ncbi:acetylornithine deacetylase [Comamonas sp. Y33R10-2]|uniref:acetylornithine deacetylase n=1 Tax=Comamonas sp. Y33R10-2 TaxID=2853257 RepID=UPI00210759B6|nr:acetylornithine deacetylase [Comamonas sp. Y33R10-2]
MAHAMLAPMLDILEKLIGFDTRSSESNLPLIEYVRSYLASYGVESTLIPNADGNKANLYATIGPSNRAGLCLSGHTDVVPASGQPWTVPAFQMTRSADRVIGRGTADMKGFIAAVLVMVPRFIETAHACPIHIALSYDEEVGCLGVRGLLTHLVAAPVKPLACIIGEPTSMQVAVAHKGKRAYRCCVQGLAGHSSLTNLGVNAVDFAAELTSYLRRTSNELRERGARNAAFVPPYSTIHTGRLSGGIALNVIPDHAELEFEIRNLPDDDPDAVVDTVRIFADQTLVPEMRQVHAGSSIKWEQLVDYPALSDDPASAWLKELACAAANSPTTRTVSFGTEGGLFQEIGVPTVVCGPGSIVQAHKADEYVTLAQLSQCLDFMESLAARNGEGKLIP